MLFDFSLNISICWSFQLQVRLLAQKKLYRHQSKVAKSRQEALKTLWTKYKMNRMSTSEYLRQCSELMMIAED